MLVENDINQSHESAVEEIYVAKLSTEF